MVNMEILKKYKMAQEFRSEPNGDIRIVYACKYEGCDKEFARTWNALDHVRMHEGVKPFQ